MIVLKKLTERCSVLDVWGISVIGSLFSYDTVKFWTSSEVKSLYTSEINKDIIELKRKSTFEKGYIYELRIYDKNGYRI